MGKMKITFKLENLSRGLHVNKIKTGLLELPGVTAVEVDLENELVSVLSDQQTSLEDIVIALYQQGYLPAG